MIKRTQNIVAESRIALPFAATYTLLVWLAAGMIGGNWWLQLICFAATSYVMVELNNQNALIRIYSRMVSCAFLVLSCAGCFLFASLRASFGMLCFVVFLLLLFSTYQKRHTPGVTFFAFNMIGLASLVHVQVVFFVPLFWLFMAFKIQSLSWRTFFASILGLLLPYWFVEAYMLWMGDFTPLVNHIGLLNDVSLSFEYAMLTTGELFFYILLAVVNVIGTVHYMRSRYKDKIRVRMLFDCFAILAWITVILVPLQPQYITLHIPILTVCVSPLIGHFLALTSTRWTNIVFWVITAATIFVTVYNLWIP